MRSAAKPGRCERRDATVLFSDVSNFTAISERLDPEDVRAIMDRVFAVILDAVHRHDGTVNQFLGDGVMALFDSVDMIDSHPDRAVAAALTIQEDLEPVCSEVRRVYGEDVRVRISINSGPIVVGTIGADLRLDYSALGHTAHMAARMLAAAAPGDIVVTDETRRLTTYCLFEPVGEITVGGAGTRRVAHAVVDQVGEDLYGRYPDSAGSADVLEAFCA